MRLGGRLFQQYVVDAFSAIEQSRLWWVRNNQTKLRNELYHNLVDLVLKGDVSEPSTVGQGIILPATYVGSARYMQQNFLDSLAICRNIGYPDLFLTMTCNPHWDEIQKMMSIMPLCNVEDCPDIITRVFKLKLDQLYDEIKNKGFFGECLAGIFCNYYLISLGYLCICHIYILVKNYNFGIYTFSDVRSGVSEKGFATCSHVNLAIKGS